MTETGGIVIGLRLRPRTVFLGYVFLVGLLSTAASVALFVSPLAAGDWILYMPRNVFLILQVVAVVVGWAGFVQGVRGAWGWASILLVGWVIGPLTPTLHVYAGLVVTIPTAAGAMGAWLRCRVAAVPP